MEEARNLFEARRAIESVTTSLAAKVILTSQLADLRRQIERQDRANKTGQFTQALLELGRFHQQLARLSNNGVLVEVIEPLLIRTSLVVAVFGHHQALATMPDQLSNIVDHLQNGTSTPAARAMEQCLYKLQSQLDWKTRPQEPLPIEQSLSRVR
ncbi:MAG: FCD domain-containing protein [Pseudomonadota bacterium]